MGLFYTPSQVVHSGVTVPVDGDAHSGVTYAVPMQHLADNELALRHMMPLTPAAIASNQTGYAPTGWGDAYLVRVSSSSPLLQLQGLGNTGINAALGQGRRDKLLYNAGANTIAIMHQHASALAGHKINCPNGNSQLFNPGDFAHVVLDPVIQQWIVASITSPSNFQAQRIYTGGTPPASGDISATGSIHAGSYVYAATGFEFASAQGFTRVLDDDAYSLVSFSDSGWRWTGSYWHQTLTALGANMAANIGRYVPQGSSITQVRIRVKPAAARAPGSRMGAVMLAVNRIGTSAVAVTNAVEDDGTTNDQELVITPLSPPLTASTQDTRYRVLIQNGSGTAGDRVHSTEVTYTTARVGPQ